SDTCRARFYQCGVGLDLDRIGNLANLEYSVYDCTAVNLENNSGLSKAPESGKRYFELVRAHYEVRQDIRSRFVADRHANRRRVRLCCGNFGARQQRTTLIFDRAADLTGRALCPGVDAGQQNCERA